MCTTPITSPARFSAALLLILIAASACVGIDSWVKHVTWVKPSRQLYCDPESGLRQTGAPDPSLTLYLDADSFYWLSFARQMLSEGRFRVRATDLDNAPYGRAVHWSSGPAWLAILLASLLHVATGAPTAGLLPTAALWIGPLLMVVCVALALLALRGRWPMWPSGLLVLSAILLPGMRRDFGYARFDHHAFLDAAVAGMILCLLAGGAGFVPIRPDLRSAWRAARRWFVAAGVLGGAALWIQASIAAPIIAGVALGFVLYTLLWARAGERRVRMPGVGLVGLPSLWLAWASAGALTSLALYLVEYAPTHFGMRLEVNHPLYAFSWLGAGALIVQVARMEYEGRTRPSRRVPLVALFLLVACAAPCAVLFGPPRWFLLRDPVLLRVHDVIDEFMPLLAVLQHTRWRGLLMIFGLFPVFAAAAAGLLLARTPKPVKALLLVSLLPSLAALKLAWEFNRFAGLATACLLCLALAVVKPLPRAGDASSTRRLLLAALLFLVVLSAVLPFGLEVRSALRWLKRGMPRPGLGERLVLRDAARRIGQALPEGSVVLSGIETPYLRFYGGLRGTGSLYWENMEGLKATAQFFADYGEGEALRIACERRLDYVIMEALPLRAAQWHYFRYGSLADEGVRRTLAWRLVSGAGVPEWLVPLSDADSGSVSAFGFRVFRVKRDKLGGRTPDHGSTQDPLSR